MEGTSGQICIVLENAADGLESDVSVTLTTTTGTAGEYQSFYRVKISYYLNATFMMISCAL